MRRRDFIGAVPFAALGLRAASSEVNRWTVVTIGNLSRNRYWGESDAKALRGAICTFTLISGEGFHLLVDPSLAGKADMARELDRRTGLRLDDVTAVFVTHEHADHFAGIEHFPAARWFAGAATADILNSRTLPSEARAAGNRSPAVPAGGFERARPPRKDFEVAPSTLFDAVSVLATPGHTSSHQSLRFEWEGQSVVVAGDAVATRDFWRERRSYFNAVDPAQAARTMDELARSARLIIPGHDNYFLV